MKGKTLATIAGVGALVGAYWLGKEGEYERGFSDAARASQAALGQIIEGYEGVLRNQSVPDEVLVNSLFRTHIYFTTDGYAERGEYGHMQTRRLLESLTMEGAGDLAVGPEYMERFFAIDEEANRKKMETYVQDNPRLQSMFDATLRLLDEVKKTGANNPLLVPQLPDQTVY